jgi:ATP-dependent DNA helicase RecQ
MSPPGAEHRVTVSDVAARAQELLGVLAGPDAALRPDQRRAIEVIVAERRRALVVQRTGFGKSAIYFIATRMLRDAGSGPALVVSPLLALMRDQVAAAVAMGVRAETINSSNPDDWAEVEARLAAGEVDLLCISPERLNSPGFVQRVLPGLAAGLGMLVVDEAHCISDWGHDFRPDYRRIRDAIAALRPGTPVLATTATANARVTADVADQLGDDVTVLRGSLDRESLRLSVVELPSMAERLAWIAGRLRRAEGTGIVYCLTVAQTELVAGYLRSQGVAAAAYSSATAPDERERLEAAFRANELTALAATSSLGMGVDKGDVAFVHHLGAPASPVAYYQQVGRAGRSIDTAEAVLLPGGEDRAIWDWMASVGLPPEPLVRRVLEELDTGPATVADLERNVDLRRTRLETVLKILDVDGAVTRDGSRWSLTGHRWVYDRERVARIEAARAAEADAMVAYTAGQGCRMEFLRSALDDPGARPCGRCDRCAEPADATVDPAALRAAVGHLRGVDVVLEPRKAWPKVTGPSQGSLGRARRAEAGRAMARVGDGGWWPEVSAALDTGTVGEDLVAGIVAVLRRWDWARRPTWVTWVPPAADPGAVGASQATAEAIGRIGKLPVREALRRRGPAASGGGEGNSAHRLRAGLGSIAVDVASVVDDGPVLLVDDLWDTGWTVTVSAALLRDAGVSAVLPFTLARR